LASTRTRPPAPRDRFLPPDPRREEPYRLTPQLALRIAVLGAVALAVFGVLFLRLWALQVLSGDKYLRSAQNNQLRIVRDDAPRGPILDRYGRPLVTNVAGTAVKLWPAYLPKEGRYRELKELSTLLNVPLKQLVADIERRKGDPLTPVTVKQGVHEDQVLYLQEHEAEFPGVQIDNNFLRKYKYQTVGAHVLGHTGEVTEEQLAAKEKEGVRAGDTVGQSGVESAYDEYLRGRVSVASLFVDSLGRPQSEPTPRQEPRAGNALRLTIDIELQRAAEEALRRGIRFAWQTEGGRDANGGAIVALDPRNGEVLALASNPTFKPSLYSQGRIDPKKLAPLVDARVAKRENYPGMNRVTAGLYPPGSTFKPAVALAAMQERILQPWTPIECTPSVTIDGQKFSNWNPFTHRWMTLPEALAESCDTYFYELGRRFYVLPPDRGHPLQAWASRFGFGGLTGIDVGPEAAGLLPTPEWRKQTFTKARYPKTWEIERLWKSGDSVQLAIGQKDLQVTPLQMARFYAMIANGGKLVMPHVAAQVESANGDVLRSFAPPAPREVGVSAAALEVVRDGLYRATHGRDGTATSVFGGFPVPIAGKTGTAEKVVDGPLKDQSWWCGYGPSDNPEIVVCALIENGGHGGTAAAPAALHVFEQYFGRSGNLREIPSEASTD
jgi:penicillin-binding protein 2